MCEVLLKSIQKSTRYLNCCDCVNCTTEFSFAWTKRQSTCFIVRLNQIEITSCDRSPRFYLWFVCEVLLKSIQKSTSKVLKLLWLRQLYNGVFIRLNKTTINMFHREIKSNRNYFLWPESKVLFVIRVRGIVEVNPKVHKQGT